MDPLNILLPLITNYGSRYIDIQLTPLQEKILKNKAVQYFMYFLITYLGTNDILKSFIIVLLVYLFINILFNENSKYNILSKTYLLNVGIIQESDNFKSKYYEILSKL